MKRRELISAVAGAAAIAGVPVSVASPVSSAGVESQTIEPVRNALGRPYRAILVTSGKYVRYRRVLMSVLEGLAALRVVEPLWVVTTLDRAAKADRQDTEDIWKIMAWKDDQEDLQFLPDGHYDYDFLPETRIRVRAEVLKRIEEKRDVDIIFTFGTAASQDMARLVDTVPVVSLASSDPVRTSIVRSADDSGKDNVHAIVINDFLKWQVTNFYAIHPFDKVGFVCAYGQEKKFGYFELQKAAKSIGAQFVGRTYHDEKTASFRDRFPAFFEAVQSLVNDGVRTIMIPWFPASDQQLAQLVRYFVENRVWSFSLSGPTFVSRGFLLGVGEESFEGYGLFEARVIKRIIAGTKPRDIGQIFVRQNRLSINLRTAMQLGWQVPFELLATADKTYTSQSTAY